MKGGKFRGWIAGLGVAILLLAGVAFGRLAWGSADDGALARVQAGGELRVGLDASFPPFESLDAEGNVVGFDADLARAIAGQWGAQPVFVNVGFDGLYDALLAGRVDVVISGLPYDPRRTQDVIYSQPYFNAGQALVVRADDTAISAGLSASPRSSSGIPGSSSGIPGSSSGIPGSSSGIPVPELLAGRSIAVEWGSLADMEARRLKQTAADMRILPQPTAQDALNALVAGQADAAIADSVSVYQFMGEHVGQVRLVQALTQEAYVVATRPRSRRLAEAIDAALTRLRRSGELDALLAKWF